jgi:outer membrane lipoprotein SlyB
MIQMTRQQYQEKYGNTQSPKKTSQPVKMTRSQYESSYGKSPFMTTQRPKKSFIEKVANASPVAGGIIGGITGGLLGGTAGSVVPGAGTVAGGIAGSGAGTALGTAGGGVIKNTMLDLFGKQKQKPMEQLKDVVKQSAIAGATDVATAGVLKGAGKILKPVAKTVGKIVDDIPLKSIRINPSQLTKWNSKHGGDLSGWMVKNKILGENAIDIADKSADNLQSQFDNFALNENLTIPVTKLRQRFADEIRNLAGVTKEGVKTDIVPSFNKDIASKVLAEWDNISNQLTQMGVDNVTPKQLTLMRRAIDEVIPKSAWTTPTIKNTALRLRSMLNDVVTEGIDSRLIGNKSGLSLKELGKELSKYYDFLDVAERQSNLGRGSMVANLPRILSSGGAGTIGALLGGVPGAIVGGTAGLAGESLLRDPNVLKGIYQGGKVASKKLPVFAKNVSNVFGRLPSAVSNYMLNQ